MPELHIPPPQRHVCLRCGHERSREATHGYTYRTRECSRCYSDWTPCRDDIDTIVHDAELALTAHGVRACVACLTYNGYRPCGECAQYVLHPRSATREDGTHTYVCGACGDRAFDSCVECGHLAHPSQLRRINLSIRIDDDDDDDNVGYCNECQETALMQCTDCGQLRPIHTVCSCGNDEARCNCSSCREDRRREERRSAVSFVNEWNYRPTLKFQGDGPLFLGMELEVETGDNYSASLEVIEKHATTNLLFLKQDGSINCGFEIVTHPMEYQWALQNFPWETLDSLRDVGAYTHDRVGIHVHLSRKGFDSPTHIFKWMKFIYRNSAHVTTIAGRQAFDWAAFDPDDRTNIKYLCKGDRGHGRYRAINTQNTETFELRVFRSSLSPHTVKAYLGLADASVKYTQALTCTEVLRGGWEWSAFYTWLADKPEYIDLRERMEELSCVS